MYKKALLCFFIFLTFYSHLSQAQIQYQLVNNKAIALGGYGRVGFGWNYENNGSIGQKLNLLNMGSIGGRMEEQDYLELVNVIKFKPKNNDSTDIHVQTRFSVYSQSLNLFGNTSSSSFQGLTLAVPEIFVLARDIKGLPLNVWVGARLYRGEDVHIADHFYFNDHSGQGFGVEYKDTRFTTIFVSSTDTASTLPPSFFINIQSGTPSLALRGRFVYALEQDFPITPYSTVTGLLEFQHLENANDQDLEVLPDSIRKLVNYPSDNGWVLGARLNKIHSTLLDGSYSNLSLRYGSRIANGGDGGVSRTYLTFGAPDLNSQKFEGAYSWSFVAHSVLNLNPKLTTAGYIIYTKSKGAAKSNDMAPTFLGQEVLNKKEDFTIGGRATHYLTDLFHLFWELHYSQRKDGTIDPASVVKFSLAPTIAPTQERSQWARPHLRFVFSLARYNDQAKETLYSPYLQFAGEKRWGHYLGIKAEWWMWD
ncbi:carbohydrate porin [Limibacter armeniacum]|uniref:carbohydrate porin n=1 Tax=Limibacter armeniacum TaxID=466084 RepID=UPI002FE61F90